MSNLRYAFGDWYEFRRQPCYVCGKTDNCLLNKDGKTIACTRETSDIVFSTRNPAWIHRLDDDQKVLVDSIGKREETRERMLDMYLNHFYTSLINHEQLTLNNAHINHLMNERKLKVDTIKERGYCSYPEQPWNVAKDVLGPFSDRLADPQFKQGIPGFYYNEYGWTMPKNNGILIPYRNEVNHIIGFQIRVDNPLNTVSIDTRTYNGLQAVVKQQPGLVQILDKGEIIGEYELQVGQTIEIKRNGQVGTVKLKKGQRYFWLSSANRKYGTGASSGGELPIHVAVPQAKLAVWNKLFQESLQSDDETSTLYKTDAVWITEGALKGDLAVEHIARAYRNEIEEVGDTMLCVAGVGSWRGLLPILKRMGVKRVNIAYDMDVLENDKVKHHYKDMVEELTKYYDVYIALWSPDKAKGVDDILDFGIKPQLKQIGK